MRSGKKQKDLWDVVNNAKEGDTIEAEHPPAAEDKYAHQKDVSDNKDSLPQNGLLIKKPRQSYHMNVGIIGGVSHVKKERQGALSTRADCRSLSRWFG